jgi:hypothetical protein
MYGCHTTQELQEYAKNFAAELRSQSSREEQVNEPSDDEFRTYSPSRWGKIRS